MSERVRKRRSMMLWARLHFHARKHPAEVREFMCWLCLLRWAELGGKADEVIR